ncbi:hypothetical protein FOA52_001981 [Chlamydomonas sp. UWO 241]|nr:hypothetical protein FOA52_001981 [Chlamydomonas sp. UWO 241]
MQLASNADNKVTISAAGAIPSLVTIAASGAIPPLVMLLGPGSSTRVQKYAAAALGHLAQTADNQVTIAAAGAIPSLTQLLLPGCEADVKTAASAALLLLANGNADNVEELRAIAAAETSAQLLQQIDTLGLI